MKPILLPTATADFIPHGVTIMISESPDCLINAIVSADRNYLTVIANDMATTDTGIGKLVFAGCIKACVVSHIDRNPES